MDWYGQKRDGQKREREISVFVCIDVFRYMLLLGVAYYFKIFRPKSKKKYMYNRKWKMNLKQSWWTISSVSPSPSHRQHREEEEAKKKVLFDWLLLFYFMVYVHSVHFMLKWRSCDLYSVLMRKLQDSMRNLWNHSRLKRDLEEKNLCEVES